MSAIQAGTIPVGKLRLADDNVRSEIGDVSEMAASMKSMGVLEPLLVREGDLLVVCGSRRLAAAKKAGLKEVPCLVRPFTEAERIQAMVVENVQRETLTRMEEANAFARLRDELSMTQAAIAKACGCTQPHVSDLLTLLDLPEKAQAADLPVSAVRELRKLTAAKVPEKTVVSVAKQLKSNPGYGTVVVQREIEKVTKERALEQALAALRKKGGPVVDSTPLQYGSGFEVPEGNAVVEKGTMHVRRIDLDPKEHAKLDCHAQTIDPDTMKPVEVCTNPANHPTKAQKRAESESKEAAKRKKETELVVEDTRRRRSFLQQIVAARVNQAQIIDVCFLALLLDQEYYGEPEDELTAVLLRIEGAGEIADADEVDWLELILLRAEKDKARVVLALALAQLEAECGVATYFGSLSLRYFDLLIDAGYKPGPREKKRLAAAKKEIEAMEKARAEEEAQLEADAKAEAELEAQMEAAELADQDAASEPEPEVDLTTAIRNSVEASKGKDEEAAA